MTDAPTRSDLSISDLLDTLTGYDEQAIEERFGAMPDSLLTTKPMMGGRALVYVVVRRHLAAAGVKDPSGKAFKHAMGMKVSDVEAFFPDEDEELELGQPETPAGEGDDSAD